MAYSTHLPKSLQSGALAHLIDNNEQPLAIIGPGPSVLDINPEHIPESVMRFRMNMFFTEIEPRFGQRVDGYFWANDLDVMYELMLKTTIERVYDYKVYFTPNDIKGEKPEGNAVANRCRDLLRPRYDHWWLISHHPDVVRNMLLRPLPSQAFQALAVALVLGYREVHLVGIDMYRSKNKRYAYEYDKTIKDRLDAKHQTPGYEAAAHSERRDIAFLQHLMKFFPDARIFNASSISPLRDILPDSCVMHGTPISVREKVIAGHGHWEARAKRLQADYELLRASTSFRLGHAFVKPFFHVRKGLTRLLPGSANAPMRGEQRKRISHDNKRLSKNNLAQNIVPFAPPSRTADQKSHKRQSSDLEVLVVAHETKSMTGGHRPICSYLATAQANGQANKLISLVDVDPTKTKRLEFPKSEVTIINTFSPLEWPSVLRMLEEGRPNVWIYSHEMGWIYNRTRVERPVFYNTVAKILARIPVLCVSEIQEAYVKATFNPPRTERIYNVAENGNLQRSELTTLAADTARPLILMVGTIQARKGVDLFSHVADLAAQRGLDYRFMWVGHETEKGCYRSPNVEWAGNRSPEQLRDLYKGTRLFFLSSFDDPFPLSCLEALSFGVPVVTYENSGVRELISGMRGCGVFRNRDPEAVFKELQRALGEAPNRAQLFFHARPFVDTTHFVQTVDKVIFEGAGEARVNHG